jgi:hypothetical protein
MRTLLLAALFAAVPAGAFAACVGLPDDASTRYVQNQTALTLCRADALHESTAARARELQLQAELAALQQNIALQQRLQQTFAAAAAAPNVAFTQPVQF